MSLPQDYLKPHRRYSLIGQPPSTGDCSGSEATLGAHDACHIADRFAQVNVGDQVLEEVCAFHLHVLTLLPLLDLWTVRAIPTDVPLP